MNITQAVILAGGLGTRLRPLTNTIPKPMIEVNSKPFLTYLIGLLKKNGIKEIVFLLGYLPEPIISYYKDGKEFGVVIKYSIGTVGDGTGTRIRNAKGLLYDYFLLLYCDNYWQLDLKKLLTFYQQKGTLASVVVYSNKDNITKNNTFVNSEGIVEKYDKSRTSPHLNGVEIGFFILNKGVIDMMPNYKFSFEEIILPLLIQRRQLAGYRTDDRYYSIGTRDRLQTTQRYLQKKSFSR